MARRTVENTLEFPYSRSLGPVVGAFMSGLRDKRILGIRDRSGGVLVPPLEHDPKTGSGLALDMVEVGPEGTVESWTWVSQPTPKHPLSAPFAFALVRPDGAASAMVHAVAATGPDDLATGARVRPRWREERRGRIDDIECWELLR